MSVEKAINEVRITIICEVNEINFMNKNLSNRAKYKLRSNPHNAATTT